MDAKRRPIKVLVTSLDSDITNWVVSFAKTRKLPWRIQCCEPLRIGVPDIQVAQQDVVIVAWDRPNQIEVSSVFEKKEPTHRSLEGMLYELDKLGGENLCKRVIVMGKNLTREDTMFLAEYGVKHIVPLNSKRSRWMESEEELEKRVVKVMDDALSAKHSPEEKVTARFLEMLPFWTKLSDENKMENTELLLRCLGDSPRYFELMARKCMVEGELQGAEKWLERAVTRNPNFLRALHLLADIYIMTNRFNDALVILEKLKASNPRSLKTLTKMGRCYAARNEPMRAEKYLSDAIIIDEFCKEAREELGKVKFCLKEFELARELFSQSSSPRPLAAYFNKIGIDLVQEGKYGASIEHYRWAQFVLPGNEQSHLLFFNIALAYAKWGRLKEAVSYARLAKVRAPEYDKAVALLKKLEERSAA